MVRPVRTAFLVSSLALAVGVFGARGEVDAASEVTYAQVAEIFEAHCMDCHTSVDPEGKLIMEPYEELMRGGESGLSIVAGDSAASLLVRYIEGTVEKDGKKLIMPPGKRKKLEAAEIEAIRKWIDAGAEPGGEMPAIARELVLPEISPKVPPRNAINALAYASGPKPLAIGRYAEVEVAL